MWKKTAAAPAITKTISCGSSAKHWTAMKTWWKSSEYFSQRSKIWPISIRIFEISVFEYSHQFRILRTEYFRRQRSFLLPLTLLSALWVYRESGQNHCNRVSISNVYIKRGRVENFVERSTSMYSTASYIDCKFPLKNVDFLYKLNTNNYTFFLYEFESPIIVKFRIQI